MPFFEKPSLVNRIAVGKAIGFIFGLIAFVSLPSLAPEIDPLVRWGILLWYPTVGAFIGIFGVFTLHPVLKLPLPWWVRGPFIGAWLNFVLIFFAYDTMESFLTTILGSESAFTSPFWFVAEGALIGLVIGYFTTKWGGEGWDTTADLP